MQLCLNTINIRNSQPGVVLLVLYPFTNHLRSQPFKVKELYCSGWLPPLVPRLEKCRGWIETVSGASSRFCDAPGPWSSHWAVQLTPGLWERLEMAYPSFFPPLHLHTWVLSWKLEPQFCRAKSIPSMRNEPSAPWLDLTQ